MRENKLFIVQQPKLKPKLRLFCFPFAGGSVHSFQSWQTHFGEDVELVCVQLKGRGSRFDEKPHQDMRSVTDELMTHSAYLTEIPFMLFGHSLGALICYALCCRLKAAQLALPLHLFASGCRAPQQPYLQQLLHALEQDKFFKALAKLNGTPAEVLANKELMELFEPVLRADFKIAETYQAEPVLMPLAMSVLYGDKDDSISKAQLSAWQELTNISCEFTELPGDHFFIQHSAEQVLSCIFKVIRQFQLQMSPTC